MAHNYQYLNSGILGTLTVCVHQCYATFRILNKHGEVLHASYVDFYSKVPNESIRFVSKEYAEDDYILEVQVSGEQPVWFNKRGDRFGSTDCYVNISKVLVK